MLKLFYLLIALTSFNIFANDKMMLPDICYSSGECQDRHSITFENRCLKVKTGIDSSGSETCTMRCDSVPVGYTCNMIPEKIWGVCKREKIFNMETSTYCNDALDPSDI